MAWAFGCRRGFGWVRCCLTGGGVLQWRTRPAAMGTSAWVWAREQVIEELVQDFGGLAAVGDFVSAEPVDLVPGEPEFAIGGRHFGIARWAGSAIAVA